MKSRSFLKPQTLALGRPWKPHTKQASKQAGKREVFSALTAAAGVEPPVKRRKRRTKAEMGKA